MKMDGVDRMFVENMARVGKQVLIIAHLNIIEVFT